jgi:Domain of unknown function (DUF4349)
MSRFSCALNLLLLCLIGVVGCGTSQAPMPSASEKYGVAMEAPSEDVGAAVAMLQQPTEPAEGVGNEPIERKIIYNATVELTVEDFTDIPARVEQLAEEYDGFIAHASLQTAAGSPRRGEWRIRIPVDRYAAFLDAAETLAELQSRTEDSQEVTAEFYDVQVRIRNKQREEERLLEHLEESTGKLEDILTVEKEISRVRTEVEQLQGRLRVLQDQTALSTVTLRIDELRGYVPQESPTFGTRISRAWTQSIDGLLEAGQLLLLAVVVCAPWLAVMAIPVGGMVLLLRRLLKRRLKAAT